MEDDNLIREFHTKSYIVRCTAEEEEDLDLSWDQDGSVAKGLDTGQFIVFCAYVEVIHEPTRAVLGRASLGNCIYESFDEFRRHAYFPQMVSEAIAEARRTYPKLRLGQLRAA